MWRVDRLSHLVDMDSDPELSYCGVRAPFSTTGGEDFDACKRCLRAMRAGSIRVTPPEVSTAELEGLWPYR